MTIINTAELTETEMMLDHQYEQALKDNAAFDAKVEERERARLAYAAQADAARAARVARELPARKAIAAKVNALPTHHVATVNEETGELTIDGVTMGYWLEFSEERTKVSSWKTRPNGKVRITVGQWGERRSFPQRKDGTHNYEEIASELVAYAAKRNAVDAASKLYEQNKPLAKALREELGLSEYYGPMKIEPSSNKADRVAVKIEVNATMSPAKARETYAALKALGIITER